MPTDLPVFAPNGISWTELGAQGFEIGSGNTLSGQVSAIAVDLAHEARGNLVYVGSSSGGVWKSTNGLDPRATFVPISDQAQSLSVGAIALNTLTNPPTIYVGTGAPDNSANISSYTGTGILISTRGGGSWQRIESADGGAHPFVGLGFSSILIDPQHPNIMLAATGMGTDPNHPHTSVPQGNNAFSHLGIYRSSDAGQTWTRVMAADYADFGSSQLNPSGFFHIELLYDVSQDRYIAGVTSQGLLLSADRGATWKPVSTLGMGTGLPAIADTHRVSLAARGNSLWALVLVAPFTAAPFRLFQSDDHGRTWHEDLTLPPVLPMKGCLMYVAAPPASNALLVAAEHLFRRNDVRDPAQKWTEVGAGVLHGDQHAIAFASSTNWYVGDDGGAWATTDGGNRWVGINRDLRTLEFHSAAADSGTGDNYVGGTQDNGTAFLTAGRTAWSRVLGADGTYCAADAQDPGAFFHSAQFGDVEHRRIATSTVGVEVFTFPPNLAQDFLTPYEILPSSPALFAGTIKPVGFDFSTSRIFLIAADNPWLVAFQPNPPATVANTVSIRLTDTVGQTIHYVAPFPNDPTSALLVAGSSLFRLTGIGFPPARTTATAITGSVRTGFPINGDLLGHAAVSPAGEFYLTKVGMLDGQKVFKSSDGGTKWINISGNLPNTPVNWIMVDRDAPNLVYVATNMGVYVATDGGIFKEQWQRLGNHLPNVPVTQLQRSVSRKLVAATFGRGVWTLDVRGGLGGKVKTIRVSPASVTAGGPTTGTVTLDGPVWWTTRVGLVAVEPGHGQLGPKSTIVSVQSDVYINAGDTQATFPVTTKVLAPGATMRSATIYATANGSVWTTLSLT